jgi:hypothetical protein
MPTCGSMHATAQALAKASLLLQHPGARPAEIKRLLFLHFYGTDFEPEERKRIASALARSGGADGRGRRLSVKPVDPTHLAVKSFSGVREGTAPYGKKRKSKRRR